ncbi:MAG: hypothetical protein JO115_01640 [Pseudonocardiales bacterium]|nr:hypothetical protein [Pseudonocardiales bacterium]
MALNSPTTELPAETGAPIPAIVSFGRTFLHEVIRLSVCAVSRGGVCVVLLALAVLTILTIGQPPPNPNPNPAILFF